MKKSLRLSALGLSTALAISGLAVVQPTIAGFQPAATASAEQTTGGMPAELFKESDNVDHRYDSAYNTFDKLYKARSFYAAAFKSVTGYEYYPEPRNSFADFAEMENGARGVVILQALDYKIPDEEATEEKPAIAARDIDLTDIGTNTETQQKALRILEHAVKAYNDTKENDEVITARYNFLNNAKSGMYNYVNHKVYRAPASVVLNLSLEDADFQGKSFESQYYEIISEADFQGIQVLKVENHAFPSEVTDEVTANAEANAAALEKKFGPIVPAAVDPQAAFDEVNAILLAVNELVDTYQYEEENADLAELSKIKGASDNLLTEIKALRESNDGQGILDKKDDAQALKERVDAVVDATINKLKEKLTKSATASKAAAQELKDDAKKAELGEQATSLLDEIGAAEGYDALKNLEEKAAALAKAIANAKDAEPAGDGNNGNGDGTNDGNGDGTNDGNGGDTNPGDTNPGDNDGDDKDGSSDKLDAGAIAGIVIGILALLGAILGGIFHFFPQLRAMLPRF